MPYLQETKHGAPKATDPGSASSACAHAFQTLDPSELMTVPRTDTDVRTPASSTREESTREKNEGQLSALQVAAGALAAVSAAVIASFFGVAGTVIGAAVASVVSTVGAAVYTESMRRTHAGLRRAGRRLTTSTPVGHHAVMRSHPGRLPTATRTIRQTRLPSRRARRSDTDGVLSGLHRWRRRSRGRPGPVTTASVSLLTWGPLKGG